ncbi:MAG TPA: RagB/SusD family nutrient uptake outer membrane protein [Ohtaekwangia sp.]
MKKIFIAAVLLTLGISSCDDFIKEESRADVLMDEVYRTSSGFESLVNASYSGLRPIYSAPWMFCSGTDMYVDGRNASPAVGLTTYKDLEAGEVAVETFYQRCYAAIQLSNTGLHYADITEQTANTPLRKGELKFLRAYVYFMLVQSFGGVPIVTDIYIDGEQKAFDRNTEEDVYEFIVSEMNEALALVPETPSFGRVGKRAIRHYLAKIHLTRGYTDFAAADDFSKAATYADEAINGYNLSSVSFQDLFYPGKEKNNEILFSLQFAASSMPTTASGGSIQASYFGPYHGGPNTLAPWKSYNLIPTSYVYALFNEHDKRWEGTFMNVLYASYYDYYNKPDKSAVKVARYFPQSWEVDDVEAWKAADPTNRNAAVITPYTITSEEGEPLVNIWEQPAQYLDNSTPSVRKFDDPKSVIATGPPGDVSTRDFYLARLGETYLIAAEAHLQLDDKATAMSRLNAVRARAEKTVGSLQLADADTVTVDLILDDRARELVGEFHRWFDLKRTGKLVERVLEYNKDVRGTPNAFTGVDGNPKILRPIPQKALELNSNKDFEQNPGYAQ